MKHVFAAALVFFAGASFASAHAPTITADSIGPLEFATFPQTHNVTGTISHNPLSSLKNLTLWVNGTTSAVIADPFASSTATTSPFALSWNIVTPGTYTVFVTARHGTTGSIGTSTPETVVITQPVVIPPPPEEEEPEECPAAPSIAAHYLKDKGIKSGSKIYKNIISLVTAHMAPGTDFDGAVACATTAYARAVKAFVEGSLQVPK